MLNFIWQADAARWIIVAGPAFYDFSGIYRMRIIWCKCKDLAHIHPIRWIHPCSQRIVPFHGIALPLMPRWQLHNRQTRKIVSIYIDQRYSHPLFLFCRPLMADLSNHLTLVICYVLLAHFLIARRMPVTKLVIPAVPARSIAIIIHLHVLSSTSSSVASPSIVSVWYLHPNSYPRIMN